MVGRNKDSKFVIYQVLYIFVITVLAIKGADLDLSAVVSKDKTVSQNTRDSLLVVIDSLNSLGLKVSLKVDTSINNENRLLKKKIENLNKNLASLTVSTNKIKEVKSEISEPAPTKENATPVPSVLPLAQIRNFIQNTWNTSKNNGNIPVEIIDSKTGRIITKILPGEEKRFDLTDQDEIVARYGNQEQPIKVDKNKPPEIKIETVTSQMNARKIYVQDLQKITAYKVTISDEKPDQINVTYSGPVSVTGPFKTNDNQIVYNVSLKIAPNEQRFDEWVDKTNPLKENDGRYKVNFFFIAVDKRTKDKVQAGESFYFTDFTR